ncbi:hypothetical protein [Streptomyces sp. ALB3]|uniref:hypothetical protein n=1 Tax=Streptomyces sp. ALB3 TaxID=3374278 RepID=UPI003789EDBE
MIMPVGAGGVPPTTGPAQPDGCRRTWGRALYGDAADPVGGLPPCAPAQGARPHGVGGISGTGCPGRDDHTHVDGRTNRSWSESPRGV